MGEKRGTPRKPATKFAHLRKKMEKSKRMPLPPTPGRGGSMLGHRPGRTSD